MYRSLVVRCTFDGTERMSIIRYENYDYSNSIAWGYSAIKIFVPGIQTIHVSRPYILHRAFSFRENPEF